MQNKIEQIRDQLRRNNPLQAEAIFRGMKKSEIGEACYAIFGRTILGETRARMLDIIAENLPWVTAEAIAKQEQEDIWAAQAKRLRVAVESALAYRRGTLGPPIRPELSETAYRDPHGEGRPEVLEAWRREINEALADIDPEHPRKNELENLADYD